MNTKTYRTVRLLILLLIPFCSLSYAQSGGEFEITKSVINTGGNHMSGGEYSLTGSSGQPFVNESLESDWQVHSGFWPLHNILLDIIFSDGFEVIIETLSSLISGTEQNHE